MNRLSKPGILLILALAAAYLPAHALQAVMTHKVFRAPENNRLKPYLELYWEIDPRSMLFDKKDGIWTGKIQTDIIIRKNDKTATEEHYILETPPIADVNILLSQRITQMKRFLLDTGNYTIDVTLTDLVKKSGEYQYSKQIEIPYSADPVFSDIQLMDTLLPATGESMYQRNNQVHLPLFTNFIDDYRKQIKYYVELYNTENVPVQFIRTFISKKDDGNTMYDLADTANASRKQLSFLYGSMDISLLSSGNYYLNVELLDSHAKRIAHKNLFFQLINTTPVAYKPLGDSASDKKKNTDTYLNLDKTYLAKYTPAQIIAILQMLVPIADPTERQNINEFVKRPNDMYARYFIYNFWNKQSSGNGEQEWKSYTEKVKKVNKLFGNSFVKGYESDRGALYLKYGEPAERVQVQNEEGAYPYEIWRYSSWENQGDVLFLFYRPGLMGSDYRLLTSTANGQVQNKNWRRDLYTSGVATSTNSRAEQYFINR